MDDLELDFSDITGEVSDKETDNWLELDFSDLETDKQESEKEISNEDITEEISSEDITEEKTDVSEKEKDITEKKTDISEEEKDDQDDWLSEIDKLLADLEDTSEQTEENLKEADKVIEDLNKSWNWDDAAKVVEQLKVDNAQLKTTVDQLQKLISKINKEKWDIMMRNTELELYWNVDDPSLIYLNWNIAKAKWGDEKSKRRIISILDDLRTELAWKTKEDEDMEDRTDMISKISEFNSSTWPNAKARNAIDDFEINL